MSASPGRFQSRLLNFLSQKLFRSGERHNRAIRHLQVATVWSAQILLYPIYALFQAVRLAGKQLQASAPERQVPQLQESASAPYLEPPTVDTPLERVLDAVKAIPPSAFFVNEQTKEKTGDRIRGVAIERETKSLVLVSDRNETLDILTFQQQQQLSRRIIEEVAAYWHYCRVRTFKLPILPATASFQPPMHLFLAAMTWMQTGSVAIAFNLFQEAALVLPSREEENGKLEDPKSEFSIPHSPSLVRQTEAPSIESAIAQSNKGWLKRVQKLGVDLVSDAPETYSQPITPESLEADKFGIKALIRAAVDFFFGVSGDTLPEYIDVESSPSGASLSEIAASRLAEPPAPAPLVTLDAEPDPWLLPVDAFGARPLVATPEPTTSVIALPASPTVNIPIGPSISDLAKRYLKTEEASISQNPQFVNQPQKKAEGQNESGPISQTQVPPISESPGESVQHTPDWIETKAYSVGYVKHPLETLLEWIDRALLWLEEIVVKVWRWVQQLR